MNMILHGFIPWLASLTAIARCFVVALLLHVALLIGLTAVKFVVTVLPIPKSHLQIEVSGKGKPYEAEIEPAGPIGPLAEGAAPAGGTSFNPTTQPLPSPSGSSGTMPLVAVLSPDESPVGSWLVPSGFRITDDPGHDRGVGSPAGRSEAIPNVSGRGDRRRELNGRPGMRREAAAADEAVRKALQWLQRQQRADGSWECHGGPEAGTALALLAFLGRGENTDSAEFGVTIHQALGYLTARVQPDGNVTGNMYAQGLVTFALAEGYAMCGVASLREPLARASRFIVSAQQTPKTNPLHAGGWRYSPQDLTADLSVSGWQIMALKSAANTGLEVPPDAFANALNFLWAMYGKPGFGYDGPATAPAMTAVGVLCAQFLGQGADERTGPALRYLKSQPLNWDSLNGWAMYSLYYASQALFQGGKEYWPDWGGRLRTMLLERQAPDGHWPLPPNSTETATLGQTPVYATALGALILETEYRFLPMYQLLQKQR